MDYDSPRFKKEGSGFWHIVSIKTGKDINVGYLSSDGNRWTASIYVAVDIEWLDQISDKLRDLNRDTKHKADMEIGEGAA